MSGVGFKKKGKKRLVDAAKKPAAGAPTLEDDGGFESGSKKVGRKYSRLSSAIKSIIFKVG
jgi:hypothetical protein